MEKTLKSIASNYGLYLGALLALLTVIAYAVNLNLFVNFWFGLSIYLLIIVIGIIAVAKVKQNFNGYATFKDAFTAYFITILIGLSISTAVSFVLFNFIDTEAAVVLKEKSIDKMVSVYENNNLPQDKLAEIVEKMESEDLYSLKNNLTALAINYLLPLSIIGLLVAAAMKKTNPNS
ncbi:DUF4199 domain-containing protein [Snuella lapsa]|uniref:DUF4199 domain-containing protein n=1 Tax=Snuella lapsa TaxID=870481 RepID=A0ABP6Y5K6_9FLAO